MDFNLTLPSVNNKTATSLEQPLTTLEVKLVFLLELNLLMSVQGSSPFMNGWFLHRA